MSYKIVRMFEGDEPTRTIKRCLTLKEARDHCRDPETSSSTCKGITGIELTDQFGRWFDGFEDE